MQKGLQYVQKDELRSSTELLWSRCEASCLYESSTIGLVWPWQTSGLCTLRC